MAARAALYELPSIGRLVVCPIICHAQGSTNGVGPGRWMQQAGSCPPLRTPRQRYGVGACGLPGCVPGGCHEACLGGWLELCPAQALDELSAMSPTIVAVCIPPFHHPPSHVPPPWHSSFSDASAIQCPAVPLLLTHVYHTSSPSQFYHICMYTSRVVHLAAPARCPLTIPDAP